MDRKITIQKDRDYYRLQKIYSHAKDRLGHKIRIGKDNSSLDFHRDKNGYTWLGDTLG